MGLSKVVTLQGKVIPFAGNGRRLGYPTANILASTTLMDGVYFGFGSLATYKNHPCLIFIGIPTTMGDAGRRVEAHLLSIVDQDYYDKDLELKLVHYHRPNKTFSSAKKLVLVMHEDEKAARKWFSQNKP